MIEIKVIDKAHEHDIKIKNEPFLLWGRMIPHYINQSWGYDVEKFDESIIQEMCFPDENYDYDEMSSDNVFIGAYDGDNCIGLAVIQDWFFKYMYLSVKVKGDYRQRGIATMLINKALEVARSRGYNGLYTIGQDNNLSACLFYIKAGFRIGGLDTEVYKGTSQEGKADIMFYLDVQSNDR